MKALLMWFGDEWCGKTANFLSPIVLNANGINRFNTEGPGMSIRTSFSWRDALPSPPRPSKCYGPGSAVNNQSTGLGESGHGSGPELAKYDSASLV